MDVGCQLGLWCSCDALLLLQSPSAWPATPQPSTASCSTPWSPGCSPPPTPRRASDCGTSASRAGHTLFCFLCLDPVYKRRGIFIPLLMSDICNGLQTSKETTEGKNQKKKTADSCNLLVLLCTCVRVLPAVPAVSTRCCCCPTVRRRQLQSCLTAERNVCGNEMKTQNCAECVCVDLLRLMEHKQCPIKVSHLSCTSAAAAASLQ